MAMQDKNKHRPPEAARKESYWPLGTLGATADGNARQEQTSSQETARKESHWPLGTLGATADGL